MRLGFFILSFMCQSVNFYGYINGIEKEENERIKEENEGGSVFAFYDERDFFSFLPEQLR